MRWLPDASRIGKKGGLVEEILRNLPGDRLNALWEGLDETQRLAVAEATYAGRRAQTTRARMDENLGYSAVDEEGDVMPGEKSRTPS
jgi:hypothetical protein